MQLNVFQANQPGANIQQALVSQLNENLQSGIQKRERRGNSILEFCNSYLKPSLAAEKEASCKKTTAIALEKQAALYNQTIAEVMNKTMELEAQSCKKSIADAVNVEKEKEARWCKKNSVMVEKVGPFKPSLNNRIGEITKYYHNYEFSMDLRFSESELQTQSNKQILVGIV